MRHHFPPLFHHYFICLRPRQGLCTTPAAIIAAIIATHRLGCCAFFKYLCIKQKQSPPRAMSTSVKVIYDTQTFDIQQFGGISRYFYEIIRNLRATGDDAHLPMLFSKNHYLSRHDVTSHFSAMPMGFYKCFKGVFKALNRRHTLEAMHRSGYDVFHPTYYDPFFLDSLNGKPFVLTIHDMIHEKFPQYFSSSDPTAAHKALLASQAARIIAISDNTRRDIINILGVSPDKIDVIYHGITPVKPTRTLSLPDSYILFVGQRGGYKNFPLLLSAFAALSAKHPQLHLVCTGRAFCSQESQEFATLGLTGKIHHFSATEPQLAQLYRQATAFVFPSLYEGFGIPILEAWANSCPVLLSNTSCFPEICDEAGVYFDPASRQSLSEALERIVSDRALRQRITELGSKRVADFTWQKTATLTHATYRKVI